MNKGITHLFFYLPINYHFCLYGSHSLNTYCFNIWLHVTIVTTTLTSTLLGLKGFATTMVVVVGLV